MSTIESGRVLGDEYVFERPPGSFIELAFRGNTTPGFGDEFPFVVGDFQVSIDLPRRPRPRVSLPIWDCSVEQVLLTDVFGDPEASVEFKNELLAEAHRIVVPGGFVVAKEVLLPKAAQEYFEQQNEWRVTGIDPDECARLLQTAGSLYDAYPPNGMLFFIDPPMSAEPGQASAA